MPAHCSDCRAEHFEGTKALAGRAMMEGFKGLGAAIRRCTHLDITCKYTHTHTHTHGASA